MARLTTIFVALFLSLILMAGCGPYEDDDDSSSSPTPACEVTDTVTGSWWEVWIEACGTSATILIDTYPTDGSTPESGQIYFDQACTGTSFKEWNSVLLAPTGYSALEVDALLFYNAIEVDVLDNLTPFYDGASES